jgi:hypothetical protein
MPCDALSQLIGWGVIYSKFEEVNFLLTEAIVFTVLRLVVIKYQGLSFKRDEQYKWTCAFPCSSKDKEVDR